MPPDKRRSFSSPLFGTFDAAFPFQHGPPLVARFCQQREHPAEIDLAVAQRTKAPRAFRPRQIAAIDSDPPVRTELGVLHMKSRDPFAVNLYERQIVDLLQQKVAGIVVDAGGGMLLRVFQKTLERGAVVEV